LAGARLRLKLAHPYTGILIMKCGRLALCALPVLGAIAPLVQAQQYPARPVRLVIPYPPGGAADIIGRMLARKLSESLHQQLVVDARGGGGQVIGTEIVASAPADGYTILQASITHTINASLVPKLPYDTVNSFAPISFIAVSPLVLIVNPAVNASSTRELIALARAQPGMLNYASSGNGSGGHLAMALLASMTKTSIVHVPYKGAAPALTDLIAGQVQCMLTSPLAAVPYANAGKLRLLAVTGKKRTPAMPDVPTVSETVPGYESVLWYAFLAPRNTPRNVIDVINSAIRQAVSAADVRDLFAKNGADAYASTPEELQQFIRDEIEKWRKVVREARIVVG
jgi:tripartite-type tricarboxylate transporter receptor subunit TctC